MSPGAETQRNVSFREREGIDEEYPLTKEHLYFILDGVRHMPDAGRIFQPLGWFVLGIAATAGIEAHNADPGSDHRYLYAALAIFAALSGLICLAADRMVKKEGRRHARWLEKYVLELFDSFHLEPPPKELTWWQRTQQDGEQRRKEKEKKSISVEHVEVDATPPTTVRRWTPPK
jgi:hypothetical protein